MSRIIAAFCVIAFTTSVRADLVTTPNLIENGTFSDGLNFWERETIGGGGSPAEWFVATLEPLTPTGGPYATTGSGGGSSVSQRLFQNFFLPSIAAPQLVSATLDWTHRWATGEPWTDGGQEYRVLLQKYTGLNLDAEVELFTSAGGPDFLAPTSETRSTTTNNAFLAFVAANLGQQIRLVFEVNDIGSLPEVAVDDISFTTTFETEAVPEPSSVFLAGLAMTAFAVKRRKKKSLSAPPTRPELVSK